MAIPDHENVQEQLDHIKVEVQGREHITFRGQRVLKKKRKKGMKENGKKEKGKKEKEKIKK